MPEYDEVFRQRGIPRTGEVVRCRQSGSLWRVLEREVWQRLEEDPVTGEDRVVPLFYLSFWRVQDGVPPRVGEMQGFLFHPADDNFASNWEVLNNPESRR